MVVVIAVLAGVLLLCGIAYLASRSSTVTTSNKTFTIEEMWSNFKTDFKCKLTDVATSTQVLSFRGEGGTIAAGDAQVFICQGGPTATSTTLITY